MPSDLLAELLAGALDDAAERQSRRSLRDVERAALDRPGAIDALDALAPADRVKIIAEVKRASPSRGPLAEIADPAALAASYADGGASAVSVLTEGRRFGGSLDDLRRVRDAVEIPVLRKDFIADRYQVFEARAAGADLVLLIVAALDQRTLESLHGLVQDLGMTALVETHSGDELSRALDIGAGLIGVNARNLSTFELDQNLFGSLAERIPDGVIRVAESAVKTADDVARYRADGADVVLVGEALVTSDPLRTLSEFLAV
ncbi:indole-3-glycerol phosphate synthase TrpC [Cryobacterium tepidiphilum]|uniref:Indole-3-glycerol phosphate synthase n=1 Tax=Cryobacterium tepidiphilum TaxID=2486026 RepID=A0A3M8LNT1_9MICO|nr:indole-3-glycerol phosphate synthase TrpC [Cryobacterium tepidiphilum]RNE66532.1 indole-3-glycerol phosphate synthase TrpC [Cryobacterium tepidiphilum]